jgi:hypothetical protein
MPCKSKFPLKVLIDAKLLTALHFNALISAGSSLIIIMHFTIRQLSDFWPVPNRITSQAFNLPAIWQDFFGGVKPGRTFMTQVEFT